jgi:hypothetical protein
MSVDIGLLNDDPSRAMGTQTLLTHDLVSDGLPTSSMRPDTLYRREKILGTISAAERIDPIARWNQPDIEEAFLTLQR